MIYTFLNTETQQIEEHSMRMSEYDEFKEKNPHLDRYHEPGRGPAMGDSVRLGIRRPDNGFREVLSKISDANYKSNLRGKLSR
jgi:hypothetical protein